MKIAVYPPIFMLLTLLIAYPAAAATIWTGPDVTVINPPFAGVQDVLTGNVILTRGFSAGIYNAAQESSYNQSLKNSPLDT